MCKVWRSSTLEGGHGIPEEYVKGTNSIRILKLGDAELWKGRMMQRFAFSGWLARTVPFMRDRMLADPRFLFIVCAEVGIDAGSSPFPLLNI